MSLPKFWLSNVLVFTLAISLTACSSSKNSSEDELDEDTFSETDADTDAVPKEAVEEQKNASSDEAPQEEPKVQTKTKKSKRTIIEGSGNFDQYQIQGGDTLMKIAFETYGDISQWKKIFEDNKDQLKNPTDLAKGTMIKVEKPSSPVQISQTGEKYLIKPGDTLGTISDDIYGTKKKWKKIWKNNEQLIQDPNHIFAGFYLYYTMTPEEEQKAIELKQNRPASFSSNPVQQPPQSQRKPASAGGGGEVFGPPTPKK